MLRLSGLTIALLVAGPATAQALPPGFQGEISYAGQQTGQVSQPGRVNRRGSIIAMATAAAGTNKSYGGALTVSLTFDGANVTGKYTGTGGLQPSGLNGTRNGSQCRLYDTTTGGLWQGRCDRDGFAGSYASPDGASPQVRISYDAGATKVVDRAVQQAEAVAKQSAARAAEASRASEAMTLPAATLRARGDAAFLRADLDEAEFWYGRAADKKDPVGARRHALVLIDNAASRSLLQTRSAAGDPYATMKLGMLAHQRIDFAESRRFYAKCAGHPICDWWLAVGKYGLVGPQGTAQYQDVAVVIKRLLATRKAGLDDNFDDPGLPLHESQKTLRQHMGLMQRRIDYYSRPNSAAGNWGGGSGDGPDPAQASRDAVSRNFQEWQEGDRQMRQQLESMRPPQRD